MNELLFREVQYPDWWVWLIVGGTGLVLPVVFVALARWAGRQDRRGVAGVLLFSAGSGFLLNFALMAAFGKLTTDVTPEAVRVAFGWVGAYTREVPLAEVQQAEAIHYRPMDHGGWGLRGTAQDRILSQKGDEGVKLQLPEGTLLLGSQQPADLAAAINQARSARR